MNTSHEPFFYLLLLKAQYQPVIQNILLWLPSAVPKQSRSNTDLKKKKKTHIKHIYNWGFVIKVFISHGAALTSWPIPSILPGIQFFPVIERQLVNLKKKKSHDLSSINKVNYR